MACASFRSQDGMTGEGDLASVYDELIEKDDGEYVFASDGRVYAVVSKAEQASLWSSLRGCAHSLHVYEQLRRTGQYEEALYELFGQAAQARFTAANAKVWQTQVCRVVRSMAIHQCARTSILRFKSLRSSAQRLARPCRPRLQSQSRTDRPRKRRTYREADSLRQEDECAL